MRWSPAVRASGFWFVDSLVCRSQLCRCCLGLRIACVGLPTCCWCGRCSDTRTSLGWSLDHARPVVAGGCHDRSDAGVSRPPASSATVARACDRVLLPSCTRRLVAPDDAVLVARIRSGNRRGRRSVAAGNRCVVVDGTGRCRGVVVGLAAIRTRRSQTSTTAPDDRPARPGDDRGATGDMLMYCEMLRTQRC